VKRVALALSLLLAERVAAGHAPSFPAWVAAQTFLFILLPISVLRLRGVELREVGLGAGELRRGLSYAGAMVLLALPFMLYGASLPSFKAYYPLLPAARESLRAFASFELAMLLLMLNTELYFRGLLLFSLERALLHLRGGRWLAVTACSVVYMLAHIGKPALEVPYSFFVGLAFGWLALSTRSIFPSLFAHYVSSLIFDVLVILL